MVTMAQSAAYWRNTHTHVDHTHSLTHLHQHSHDHFVRSAISAITEFGFFWVSLKVPEALIYLHFLKGVGGIRKCVCMCTKNRERELSFTQITKHNYANQMHFLEFLPCTTYTTIKPC